MLIVWTSSALRIVATMGSSASSVYTFRLWRNFRRPSRTMIWKMTQPSKLIGHWTRRKVADHAFDLQHRLGFILRGLKPRRDAVDDGARIKRNLLARSLALLDNPGPHEGFPAAFARARSHLTTGAWPVLLYSWCSRTENPNTPAICSSVLFFSTMASRASNPSTDTQAPLKSTPLGRPRNRNGVRQTAQVTRTWAWHSGRS